MRGPLAAVAALLVVSCSGEDPPQPARPKELVPETELFVEAATLCTRIVNEAVVGGDLPSPDDVYVDVLGAIAGGPPPSAASRAAWADELADHLAAAAATKERLASIAPPAELDEQWTRVVNAYDDATDVLADRAAALAGGPWVEVRVAFGSRPDSSEVDTALTGIGLGFTDCAHVFRPDLVQPPEQWRDFTAAAATICTEVVGRRALAGFGADADRVALAEQQVAAGDDISSPDDVDAALGRHAEEWRRTADEFAAIDPAESPSPATWAALGDLAAERVSVAGQRRAAIATSNDEAMAAAFAVPDYRQLGVSWELLLLEGRGCRGVDQ